MIGPIVNITGIARGGVLQFSTKRIADNLHSDLGTRKERNNKKEEATWSLMWALVKESKFPRSDL